MTLHNKSPPVNTALTGGANQSSTLAEVAYLVSGAAMFLFSNGRRILGLMLQGSIANSAIWWGFEPPLVQGIIASVVATVFIVGWHVALLRYMRPQTFTSLDNIAVEESERVRVTIAELIDQGRCALLLHPQTAGDLSPDQFAVARAQLETDAVLVPGGQIEQGPRVLAQEFTGAPPTLVPVPSFWIDRNPVTNHQFEQFVAAGGYAQASLWESDAKPLLPRFIDLTGQPGPAFWEEGRFVPGTAEQPVVGVSWYEALAYARWVGKQLPTDAQWLRVASWPAAPTHASASTSHQSHRRYPWGDQFEEARSNLQPGGSGRIVPVSEYAAGSSGNGVQQLLGNVWEWTCEEFEHLPAEVAACRSLTKAGQIAVALKITRGGAYDTELDGQTAVELIHAECPLARVPNVGFRCALGWNDILPATALAGYRPPPSATWLKPENPLHARVRRELAADHGPDREYLRQENDLADVSLECAQSGSSDSGRSVESSE